VMIACKLLDISYEWVDVLGLGEWHLWPVWKDASEEYKSNFWEHVKTSQTHGAFINLIDGEADIILTHRTISPDEKAHAITKGVTLIETPIALDAFVFIVNNNNKVNSLTVEQIQQIYTGDLTNWGQVGGNNADINVFSRPRNSGSEEVFVFIVNNNNKVNSLTIEQIQQIYTGDLTNWAQVGGNNADINVFTRPRNSGSEEIFRTLVMNGLEPASFPEEPINPMAGVFREVRTDANGICYTFNNYKNMQARVPDSEVPKIAINNIFPDNNTIRNRTYPFISEVHVAIRSDLDHNSMAYNLYMWLQSENAKPTITECGFIPK